MLELSMGRLYVGGIMLNSAHLSVVARLKKSTKHLFTAILMFNQTKTIFAFHLSCDFPIDHS